MKNSRILHNVQEYHGKLGANGKMSWVSEAFQRLWTRYRNPPQTILSIRWVSHHRGKLGGNGGTNCSWKAFCRPRINSTKAPSLTPQSQKSSRVARLQRRNKQSSQGGDPTASCVIQLDQTWSEIPELTREFYGKCIDIIYFERDCNDSDHKTPSTIAIHLHILPQGPQDDVYKSISH